MDLISDRGRRVQVEELNTTKLLAHAAKQTRDHKFDEVLIVDVDAHHYENENLADILPFMENDVLRQLAQSARAKSRGTIMPQNIGYQDMGGRVTRYPMRSSEKTSEGKIRDVELGHRWMDAMSVDYSCLFPTGMLGLGITALMASFMSGMAGNVTAFNTVWTYDLYQAHVVKGASDEHYLRMGRLATVGGILLSVAAAWMASAFNNILEFLQLVFAFVNAPLFATFALGMFWKRSTPHAGWSGLVVGTLSAVTVWVMSLAGVFTLPGQGTAFLAATVGFVADIIVSIVVSLFTEPKPAAELVRLVYSETPKEHLVDPLEKDLPWYRRTVPLGMTVLAITVVSVRRRSSWRAGSAFTVPRRLARWKSSRSS